MQRKVVFLWIYISLNVQRCFNFAILYKSYGRIRNGRRDVAVSLPQSFLNHYSNYWRQLGSNVLTVERG